MRSPPVQALPRVRSRSAVAAPADRPTSPFPYVDAALMNFFRPGGLNPSIIGAYASVGDPLGCIPQAITHRQRHSRVQLRLRSASQLSRGCVPFGDMDANYSNGSSIYHGFSANLRKRFASHYEFLASYTWSHSIDDSTDLQSTLTPQDSYYPANRPLHIAVRSAPSLRLQRRLSDWKDFAATALPEQVISDWTFAPLLEISSGRPFNILTGSGDNLQLSSLTEPAQHHRRSRLRHCLSSPSIRRAERSRSHASTASSPRARFRRCCNSTAIWAATPESLRGQLSATCAFPSASISPNASAWTSSSTCSTSQTRYNVAAVSPLFTNAGAATAAYDPRQFQFAMKINW